MTVKIIDDTPDPEVVKHISCRNCGVRLEYVPNDVKSYHGRDYQEWVDCPKCKKEVIIRQW